MLVGIFVLAVSCKDDKELVPVWESGVNGEGLITSVLKDLRIGDEAAPMDFSIKWISIDGKLDVTKMDVFLNYNEEYTDVDGNPAIANHGEVLWASYEGGNVPSNREPVAFSITQDDLFQTYQNSEFDYGDGNGLVNVFTSIPVDPDFRDPGRDTTKLAAADKFTIRWEFTTSDGRVFGKYGNGWGTSVCTELPGSNCSILFGVGCAVDIEEPAGDWVIDMVDTYGDGWQGGYIGIIIDGEEADKAFLLSQYEPGGVPIGSGQKTVTVPGTVTELYFEWNPDDYNSEVEFVITSPKGNVVANVAGPTFEGKIKLDLCKE